MKKIAVLFIVLAMSLSLFACSSKKGNAEYVLVEASDLLKEDFGIGVKKGDKEVLDAVNKVIDQWVKDGTMTKYVDYYTALADYAEGNSKDAPDAGDLKTEWTPGNGGVITVYTESGFAPFEFILNNEIVGVDMAIMSQAAEDLGRSIEIKDVAFDTIPTSVQSDAGSAVGAAGLSITEDRAEIVDFSSIYFSSTLVIVSEKSDSYDSVAALAGKKVGVQQGTSGDLIISGAISADGYSFTDYDENDNEVTKVVKIDSTQDKVMQYQQYALAFADLKAGRIDAILMDKLPAQTLLSSVN